MPRPYVAPAEPSSPARRPGGDLRVGRRLPATSIARREKSARAGRLTRTGRTIPRARRGRRRPRRARRHPSSMSASGRMRRYERWRPQPSASSRPDPLAPIMCRSAPRSARKPSGGDRRIRRRVIDAPIRERQDDGARAELILDREPQHTPGIDLPCGDDRHRGARLSTFLHGLHRAGDSRGVADAADEDGRLRGGRGRRRRRHHATTPRPRPEPPRCQRLRHRSRWTRIAARPRPRRCRRVRDGRDPPCPSRDGPVRD